ncbi:MAG: hypothetical protein AB7I50_21305 [Vicinamibacterales bacterium]
MSHETGDQRDPLRAAFTDHQRAPRDIVPHVEHGAGDLRRLADGTKQVQITHYEMTADGITKHAEWATITRPITTEGEETP